VAWSWSNTWVVHIYGLHDGPSLDEAIMSSFQGLPSPPGPSTPTTPSLFGSYLDWHCKSQVLRDARVRNRTSGAAAEADEQQVWLTMAQAVVRKRKAANLESVGEKLKQTKRKTAIPHLASKDLGMALHNGLVQGCDPRGLNIWLPNDADRCPTDDLQEGEEADPPMLVAISDEQIQQPSLFNFLANSCKRGRVFWRFGNVHRRHNDWNRALSISGNMGVWLPEAFIINVAYGPFNGAAFFSELEDLGNDLLAFMTVDDPVLEHYWDEICDAHGWLSPEERDRDARADFVKGLPLARPFRVKGLKAALSRWYSIHAGVKATDKDRSTKKLAFALLCKRKGWIDHVDDLSRATTRAALPPAASAVVQEAASSSGAAPSPAHAKEVDSKDKTKPAKKSTSVAKHQVLARSSLDTIVKGSANSMHAVARLLHQPDRSQMIRAILDLGQPTVS
jgi:hypothetical protein